jgi:hypothetical protein
MGKKLYLWFMDGIYETEKKKLPQLLKELKEKGVLEDFLKKLQDSTCLLYLIIQLTARGMEVFDERGQPISIFELKSYLEANNYFFKKAKSFEDL